MLRFGKRQTPPTSNDDPWSLDRPLLRFGGSDAWTIRDACAGTLIFGDTGSGKTSGSGQTIAMAMLEAGFGGLVLTVKSSETDRWRQYMDRCGRAEDLVVFSPEGPHRFNFLEYERRRMTRGGGNTENLVELFVTVMNAGASNSGTGTNDPFWDRSLRQLLRNLVDALRLADRDLTLDHMRQCLTSAPLSREEADSDDWKARSFLFDTLATAGERAASDADRRTLEVTAAYWLDEFAETMDPRTRGNIVSTFTTTADGFMRGDLHELFGTTLTLTPEETLDGKVIVIDLPQKQFMSLGRVAQLVWKTCWQRAVEAARRDEHARPVMLWADEAQNFITADEPGFIQTVRESKGCCVYLTQTQSNYRHALGPGREAAVQAFLGTPKTKIFHCNGDADTNEWAQKTISDDWQQTRSHNFGSKDGQNSTNLSRTREPRVFASDFGALRCGGPPDFVVQGILFQSGRVFESGEGNTVRIAFDQRSD